MLAFGILLFSVVGHPSTPGGEIQEYGHSVWAITTGVPWGITTNGGHSYGPFVWVTAVVGLLVSDVIRCVLIVTDRWHSNKNHQDMTWSLISTTSIPLVFAMTTVTLGHDDTCLLICTFYMVMIAGVCGATVEQIRSLVNTDTIPGIHDTVMVVLRLAHDVLITVITQVAWMPLLYHIVDQTQSVQPEDLVAASTLSGLAMILMFTQYRCSRLCSIFEKTWHSKHSTTEWSMVSTQPIIPQSNYRFEAAIVVQPFEVTDHTTTSGQSGKVKTITPIAGPETLFKTLYGCHADDKSISADAVHITDQDNQIVTVNLTEDFNMYNQLHNQRMQKNRSDIGSTGAPKGMHVAFLGVGEHLFHTYLDEDGHLTRQMIGHLTEWRRYYLTNILINALLVINLFAMTGSRVF
ncbi:hypothetical protein T484DRAFT_1757277 [Baffinella frigidus]|nr:hypothetical protein T484DRAFT_1757277 [Cryptophyta sp. CCMP2293]